MNTNIRITRNTTDRLNDFIKLIAPTERRMLMLGNEAIGLLQFRTAMGRDEQNATFPAYSDRGTYYAPIDKRPAGYPRPSGGRTTHKITGQPLKTVAYDDGYAGYKTGIGRGANPQLSVSHEMLNDMITEARFGRATIFFATGLSRAKAHGHYVSGRFKFFGLDYATIEKMHDEYIHVIAEAKEKAGIDKP